ncbi:MAG: hypothetical protein CMN72_16090 [Sphingomonas sp.]|nr:hypothetical protein [Sphingomonas sp.]
MIVPPFALPPGRAADDAIRGAVASIWRKSDRRSNHFRHLSARFYHARFEMPAITRILKYASE